MRRLSLSVGLILLAVVVCLDAAMTDNLSSHWTLNETSGTRNDAHSTNHLTDNNTVLSATGKISNAGDFERANSEYLSIGDVASLSVADEDFAIAMWVNLESKPAGENMYAVSKGNGTTDPYDLFHRGFSADDRFWMCIANFAVCVQDATAPSLATWYFLVGWHDAVANTINLQVNNGTVNSAATAGTAPTDEAGEFRLGNYSSGTTFYWDGLLDSVWFWKRIPTAQERTDLYNAGAGCDYPCAGGAARPSRLPFFGIGE